MHAFVEGDGPDVVLLHGASGSLRDFTFEFAGRLARHFRVTAFDRPGLGHSERLHRGGESPSEQAAMLDAAAAQLGIRRAVIVGHSYGGAVAMAWALDRPERVAAVVSLAGATMPWPGELGLWYRVGATPVGGWLAVRLATRLTPRSVADRAIAAIFAPQPVPDGYVEHMGVPLTLRRPKVLGANVRQVGGLKPHLAAMSRRYPTLRMPVEIVHGTSDSVVYFNVHACPTANLLPDAKLTELPGVGHMPHHANPEASAEAVIRAASRGGLN
ncbi:alpha/beta fold hydrolase [Tropicimonas isoalkanivorans]|uniref:alpha/beta fold hydrolase n=1 Tax=Tropicimonas isoalkanivorans TaxID=441112 RepID=UPI001FE1D341|nr:alpha/beta hydrolase [Tropicimonas isoalkanivorans]